MHLGTCKHHSLYIGKLWLQRRIQLADDLHMPSSGRLSLERPGTDLTSPVLRQNNRGIPLGRSGFQIDCIIKLCISCLWHLLPESQHKGSSYRQAGVLRGLDMSSLYRACHSLGQGIHD